MPMHKDVGAILWKELRELWLASQARGTLIRTLLWIAIFGVMLPSGSGLFWLRSPVTLYAWAWFPMFFTSAAVTGAFAREREQHTLETLLASRIPDRAILWGKMAAAVIYGWGLNLISALVGLVVVNAGNPGLHFFDPAMAVGGFAVSLLTACLVAGAGVLISMNAPTFQAASQGITIVVLVLFLPMLALDLLPEAVVGPLQARVLAADVATLAGWTGAALAGVNAVLMALALSRFRRSRLLLEG